MKDDKNGHGYVSSTRILLIHNVFSVVHIKSKHSEELRNVRERSNIVLLSEFVINSKIKEVNENMWVYYNKLSFSRAKCKYCVYECNYCFNELFIHMKKKHKAIFELERAHQNQEPWIYFKYSYEYISDKKILHSECLTCGKFLTDSEFIQTHILEEHSIQKRNFIYKWEMKYCKQSDVTNEVKCTICCEMITIKFSPEVSSHTMECHTEKLQPIISKKATDKLRHDDYSLKDFKATCQVACGERTCGFESCYIDIANFNKHVKEKHKDIYNYEKALGHTFPWKHFSYLTSYSLKCRCNNNIDFNRKLLTMHLDEHPLGYFLHPSIQKSWEWKYCRQISDFEVQCNSCPESRISLNILLWNLIVTL
nr:PREDICTED: uncharacterized protein LOC105677368 isoform X2 [Linepithema humile]